MLLHLTTREEWDKAQAAGIYEPPSLAEEGFVHLSAPNQVLATADRHFAGVRGLVMLTIAAERLSAPLRYETVTDRGEMFPHLYGPLNLDAVTAVVDFPGAGPA
ncbi:MAG TPA: DUF952 domain-containing protein [Sporichthyaceae bacterium]|nr:DUF952 domain-containing protein [Sporichthyaceae bacterium]